MNRVRSGPQPAPAVWRRLLLVALTLAGLVVLHQLGGPPPQPHHRHAASHGVAFTHCDCPDGPHRHPGQACQAKPPHSSSGVPAPAVAFPPAPATPYRPLSASTADRDAAGGSGCGPPARSHLAVWLI